jgi:DNA-binding winged helix-turn-helix (wHTH) protein/Tol biopolymer transport system component
MLASQPKPAITFGPFHLDTAKSELRKHGVRVKLARQPWQVLVLLIERSGEVVTREEIRQRLWSTDTFVDFDHGLNATINRLRQALGDSADSPRYIETVPGQGYRFAVPVATPSEPEPPPPPSGTERKSSVLWSRERLALLTALVTLIILTGAIALRLFNMDRPVSSRRAVRFTIVPPSGFALEPAASRQAFAISPDGSRVAFTGLGDDGQFRLWVRDLSHLEPREIPNTRGLHSVFWSQDSESLFYSVRGSVRRIRADGTAHQIICELPDVLHLGTWLSPDRVLLSNRVVTFIAPAGGGAPTQLRQTYAWPQMLPDGNHVLYIRYDPKRYRNRLMVSRYGEAAGADLLETDSRATYAASNDSRHDGYLLYVRGGTLLAHPFDPERRRLTGEGVPVAGNVHFFQPTGAAEFSVSQNGTLVYLSHEPHSQIQWLDREGRKIGQLGPTELAVKCLRLSPDGRKIAAAIRNAESGATEMWVFDTVTGAGRVVIPGPGIVDTPTWSPDSRALVYSRALGSMPQLYRKGIVDEDREERLPAAPFQMPTDWSRDGRFVLYTNTPFPAAANEREGNVSLLDLGTRTITTLLESPSQETNAVFSPDGSWISYISNDSGRAELYVQAFDAGSQPRLVGERMRISVSGALYVKWRGDGKELVYLGTDGLMYGVPVLSLPAFRAGPPTALFRVPVTSRAALPSMYGFDVSADGRRFLLPMTQSDSRLVVIENWESSIRKQ